MTDTTERAYDKALVERTHFEKVAMWLPQVAVHHFNAGQTIIKGKTFVDCLIEGPGVIFATDDCVFDACNLGFAEDPSSLLLQAVGPKVTGVVAFEACTFKNCRFAMIGFMGSAALRAQFVETVKIATMTGGGKA